MVVRGCMVLHVRDEDGRILSDPTASRNAGDNISSTKRILRVALDPAQYAMDARSKYGTKIYDVSTCKSEFLTVFHCSVCLLPLLLSLLELEPRHATSWP